MGKLNSAATIVGFAAIVAVVLIAAMFNYNLEIGASGLKFENSSAIQKSAGELPTQ